MSAQQLLLPFRPVINLKGGLEAGATVDVFESGTTTRAPIYSDAELTNRLPNPFKADGFGAFPAIYFNDDQLIRVVIKQADGVVLSDTDPYFSNIGSAEEAADRAAVSAQIASAFSGPLYLTISAGLANTTNNEEFAVDNDDGTATIYVNSAGTEVFRRTIIIIPQRPEASQNIGFRRQGTGAVTRTVDNKLREHVSVKDFGAIGDGTFRPVSQWIVPGILARYSSLSSLQVDYPHVTSTSDTIDWAAIQGAINSVNAIGGGTVRVVAGNYCLNKGLTYHGNNVTVEGEGPRATRFTTNFASGDIIRVGNGTANPDNVTLTGFAISSTIPRVSGSAIVLQNTFNCKVKNFRLDANMSDGVFVEGGPNQFQNYISDFVIDSGFSGILLGNTGLVQGIYITGGLIANCTGPGILARNVSGWYIDHLDIIRCFDSITTFPSAGQQTNAAFLSSITADTSTEYGFKFLTNGGFCGDLNLVNCWAATCGEDGVFINEGPGNVSGILFSGCRFINNGKHGSNVVTGDHITFVNCHSFSNSTDALNGSDGFCFGAGMGNFSVIGGSSCNNAGLFPGGNQRSGVSIAPGCDNFSIIGVDVQNNATAGILDNSTGPNKVIEGCVGYKTSNIGPATVPSGASSVVVNHGLSVTPELHEIQLSPISDVTERFRPTSPTATTFTITLSAAAGADRVFSWSVRSKGS